MPVISVIIPVYNAEKTIKETIESVLNQTFYDWEIIIINDGSEDASAEIIYSIQDSRLKIFSYPNSGVSTSRNRGINLATGEFIAFLDADDLWTTDKLEAQLKALEANPEATVAYSWTDFIDESGGFLHPGSHPNLTGDVYANMLLSYFMENCSNPLVRKSALLKVGGFNESLSQAEDWELWIRIAASYHFVVVPRTQILYRMSANSASTNVAQMETQALRVIQQAFDQAPNSLQYFKKYSIANLYQYLIYRALEGSPNRSSSLVGAGYLWKTVRLKPSVLWQRRRLMAILFLKILAGTLLPDRQAEALLARLKELSRAK